MPLNHLFKPPRPALPASTGRSKRPCRRSFSKKSGPGFRSDNRVQARMCAALARGLAARVVAKARDHPSTLCVYSAASRRSVSRRVSIFDSIVGSGPTRASAGLQPWRRPWRQTEDAREPSACAGLRGLRSRKAGGPQNSPPPPRSTASAGAPPACTPERWRGSWSPGAVRCGLGLHASNLRSSTIRRGSPPPRKRARGGRNRIERGHPGARRPQGAGPQAVAHHLAQRRHLAVRPDLPRQFPVTRSSAASGSKMKMRPQSSSAA